MGSPCVGETFPEVPSQRGVAPGPADPGCLGLEERWGLRADAAAFI